MLYYDRDDVIKGTGTDGNNSKECIICHFQLVIHGFKFQNFVLNDCHDLTVLCLNLGNITIITLKMLISIVLFMKLANLQPLIYQRIMYLKTVAYIK